MKQKALVRITLTLVPRDSLLEIEHYTKKRGIVQEINLKEIC